MKTQTLTEQDAMLVPIEQYTLILKHEYVDGNGERHEFEKPIKVSYTVCMDATNQMQMPKSVVVNEMMERMGRYVIERMER